MVIVLDGFISSVAGLIAARLEPAARGYFVAAHRSVEAGHRAVLDALDLVPLLDLGMRLGEGSGAALALNLIHSAADIMRDMATFESAGVANRATRVWALVSAFQMRSSRSWRRGLSCRSASISVTRKTSRISS